MSKAVDFKSKVLFQKEADREWAHKIGKLPGCERIYSCIQCGTCSSTCPLSIYMDFTPRRIIALVREGFREDALRSKTIWLCSSCYSCTARCPQDIKVTDVMYNLKREAIKYDLFPSRFPIPILAKEFYKIVKETGRNDEFRLILNLAFNSNPLMLFNMMGTGFNLFRTGRLFHRCEGIKGIEQLQKALTEVAEVKQ